MISLYDIKDWDDKPVPFYITEEGVYVLEGDLVYVFIEYRVSNCIRSIIHSMASLLNEDDLDRRMAYNKYHINKRFNE